MSTIVEAILESWDRQTTIFRNLANSITPELSHLKAAEGEWDIEEHLRHVHNVRKFWLSKFAPEFNVDMERLYVQEGDDWKPIGDLAMIQAQLDKSAKQVSLAVKAKLVESPEPNTYYDHPIFFLQHMVWHEGWHTGSILTVLRINGFERPEEWEEPNIWGVWRTE